MHAPTAARSAFILLGVVLVTSAGVGCAALGLENPFQKMAERTEWVYYKAPPLIFEAAGPIAVDVDSFGGDVTIQADPELSDATVRITYEARHGALRAGEASSSLKQITHSASIIRGELGPVLQVRTRTIHAEPHFQRAHINITLPEVDGVTVRTRDGEVLGHEIKGPVDVNVTNANVRIVTHWPMVRPVTILVNRQGSIDYRVRGESTAAFDCESLRGRVFNRIRSGELIVQEGTTDRALMATLNRGTNPVILRAADGDIRIAVVGNPAHFGRQLDHM